MPGLYCALNWLARRRAGESVALIARRAGVTEATAQWATKDYGPFSRPTEQVKRTQLSDDALSDQGRGWVQARRLGRTTTSIAQTEGRVPPARQQDDP